MRVFYEAIIVHLILNLYVFIRGWKVLPDKKRWKIPYAALFSIELVLYLIGFFANVHLPENVLRPIVLMGTSWMVFIGYLTALFLIYDIVKWLGKWIQIIRNLHLQSFLKRRIYILFSLVLVIASMAYGSYRFWHPVVVEKTLTINKKVEGLGSLKIVAVSDVHVGYLINKKILNMYVDRIMAQKPDLILLVGDIIDYDLPPLIEQHMDDDFRKLQAPYGVYASTGNHEYRLNAEEKIEWLSKAAGMTVLRDSVAKVANKFYVIGREDDEASVRKTLPEILKNVDRKLPLIVMNHEPKKLGEEVGENVDLAVYGHTHDGQLFPYNLILRLYYEVVHGYKKKNNTHIYVSSGIGLAGPQYRIGTISEIAVLNLKFQK